MAAPETGNRVWWRSTPIRIVAGVVFVIAGLWAVARLDTAADRAPTAPATPAVAAASAGITSGTWIVGTDVQPGTYRSDGPNDAVSYCMWSRHRVVTGDPFEGIIASDGTTSGQTVVTIAPTDKVFITKGCAPFERV